jgi:hypothetical protein
MNGMRVSANDFMNFALMAWTDPFNLMIVFMRHEEKDISIKYRKIPDLFALPQNPNTEDLIARANKIINQAKGCAEFLQNLMSKAKEMTRRSPIDSSIQNILKTVGEQGKVTYGDTIKKYYGFEGATTQGSIQSGNAGIELPFPTPFQSFQPKAVHDRMAAAFAEQRAWSDAQSLIHESFHLAGYSDRELMEAAAALAKVEPPNFSNLTPNNRIRQESLWWTYRLQAACPPVR